jgi:hypothetical protein
MTRRFCFSGSPSTALYRRNLILALRAAGRSVEASEAIDAFSETYPYPEGHQDLFRERAEDSSSE